ncbi:MAG TPA: hypothetical protein VJT50_03700 [Pyrinomonadaceae bacterium]|nr:hypothetical protein [Pyrinomonadaceae bacterium]
MKQLLIIVTVVALISSCRQPARVSGSIRNLIPQQVGNFKLQGEVKPVDIPPSDKYQSGALRPTEGLMAHYEASGGAQLFMQVINYPSASDAAQALNQMVENVRRSVGGAKVTESTRVDHEQKAPGRKVVVEGFAPGFHAVMWVDSSVFYQVSGKNLDAILEFERNLP